jgi:hypothetical protein
MNMAIPVEVLFHRNIWSRYPKGRADLDSPELHLTEGQTRALNTFRETLNGALQNAALLPGHVAHDPIYFDYIDTESNTAEAFGGDGWAFIGVSVPRACEVLNIGAQLAFSPAVCEYLPIVPARTERDRLCFFFSLFAMFFIATHEFCHHVLGHQPEAIPQGDARTATLRGNLQSQTREIAADGYAALYLFEHFINGADARGLVLGQLLVRDRHPNAEDRILFMSILASVASTLYQRSPDVLTADNVYDLAHPPRAARLAFFMEHVLIWSNAFRRNLTTAIGGQQFANFMFTVGLAVCENPADADSAAQNGFMRSPEGQEYSRMLRENLQLHKDLMGS